MTEDNCLNCEHYEQIRGNKYPKGICHQHFMTRKSDGFPVNLLIHGNDLFICKDYVRKESTKSREAELMNENIQLADKNAKLRASLNAILDAVDYTTGAYKLNNLARAVLPYELIEKAREALK